MAVLQLQLSQLFPAELRLHIAISESILNLQVFKYYMVNAVAFTNIQQNVKTAVK